MADGSREGRADPKQNYNLTFSAPASGHSDTEKCSDKTLEGRRVKLSFYTELESSDFSEGSDSSGVVAGCSTAVLASSARKTVEEGDDRKKRCFDRYDSSESSDSGVAVLSPTESSGCSSSDITEPSSPRSPEPSERMPPWVSEPAPAARRAPVPRPRPRRITEYFNHKMKPQNGLKRDPAATPTPNDDKKCLPKNGVAHDLEKYITYLSQTLSPKVLLDVGKQNDAAARKPNGAMSNEAIDKTKSTNLNRASNTTLNGILDFSKPKDNKEKVHTTMNGFVDVKVDHKSSTKETLPGFYQNGGSDAKRKCLEIKTTQTHPQAQGFMKVNKNCYNVNKVKLAKPVTDMKGVRIAPATSASSSNKKMVPKPDTSRMNGVVSSTTKLDSRMNGVTCGSNNLNLNPITPKSTKKETQKKQTPTKRVNRKSSACIANSKNITWSKANNLKQVQMQQQSCINSVQSPSISSMHNETNNANKINIPNGMRQVSVTMNGNLTNINMPVTNLQNCHQLNIPQPCNGSVTTNNLASFVAVPQNVMLTTLRIPQNGIPAQSLNQQNNMTAFNRTNVSVTSPSKLNGQFMFPFVQNINGAVVQIPNLMAKMPNFVVPQPSQLNQQRQDHLQNQQFLINGTLLKLANTMPPTYQNVNKPMPGTSQSIPVMNKNVPAMQAVGMTVQPKQNYVNLSHPMLMPQPGFIVTSVPNMNVKETWSYTNVNTASSSSQTSCSNALVHHPPPMVANLSQAMHTSSIPIAPVKPPDNPIQGTDPPSSTVKEPEISEPTPKCDIPWLSKTFNNNIISYDEKLKSRPFAQVSCLTEKLQDLKELAEEKDNFKKSASTNEELRKVEEVARREETLFTQITVLKDVSSNVQNTLIESNFCIVAKNSEESSESGIGTDKSIDSPSDSHTSKDCDEDSSLSLSVTFSPVEVPCQKSPILKAPKTLRFPRHESMVKVETNKRKPNADAVATVTVCLWEECKKEFCNDSDLLEHLKASHVETQAGRENYVCLWERCKVRGKPSCSRLWLERHAMSHGGNKPFKCIVDNCDRRFSTQILLERHVNNHFNEVSPNANSNRKSADSAPKLIRRNGKKLRYRREPWSARMFDFFDCGMMEGLRWRLARCTAWRLAGACPLRDAPATTITLTATVRATRRHAARAEALLTYYPPHVIEDEWVPAKDVKRIKKVHIPSLPAHTKVILFAQLCASYSSTQQGSPPPKPTPQLKLPPPKPGPARMLPPRNCTSSRLLNNLLKKRKSEIKELCNATNTPMVYVEEKEKVEVTGAKKRKIGRIYGGNSFWPCGR